MQKYKIPFNKLIQHSNLERNNNHKKNLISFYSSFKSSKLRNFSTINNTIFNNNSTNNSADNFFNQILSKIKELDKISDKQIYATTTRSLQTSIYSQIDKLQTIYQDSYSLELKKHQVILQSVLRGLLFVHSENYEANLNQFLNVVDNTSDRIKNLIKVEHEVMKQLQQQLSPNEANELKDLPQGIDWFKEYVKEEMKRGSIVYQEFSSNISLNDLLSSTDTNAKILHHHFMKESKEFRLIIGFYLTTYYLSGVNIFGNIVRNSNYKKELDNLVTIVTSNIKNWLESYKVWGNELDVNYKIKDFELLDEDITLQSCLNCFQFLQLLLQSNGDSNSIQKVLDNYKEKHQSNHIFSFIYSMILYNLNRKQEAHDILKQLTLTMKENKALQPTTLPIAYWFLRVCADLNVNKEKKDIDSLKLACEEAEKGDIAFMRIISPSLTIRCLREAYQLCDDYENHFNTCFTILSEIPYLLFEEQLLSVLQMFCFVGFKQLENKQLSLHSMTLFTTVMARYAACFPSNVGVQYLFLEVKEKMGLMKDKNELLKEHTKLYELCNVPTEEMKKHNADMIFLPIIKQEIRKKLMTLQQTE